MSMRGDYSAIPRNSTPSIAIYSSVWHSSFAIPKNVVCLSESVLPAIVRDREPDELIRVWVAGCATGEEAYSLAILFHETCLALGRPFRLKLFATDLHRASLEQAGAVPTVARCSKGCLRSVGKYFEFHDGKYIVNSEIRKLIVFCAYNVLSDAPFTDLDFVSCRNMLIYFQPVAQRRCGAVALCTEQRRNSLAGWKRIAGGHCQ